MAASREQRLLMIKPKSALPVCLFTRTLPCDFVMLQRLLTRFEPLIRSSLKTGPPIAGRLGIDHNALEHGRSAVVLVAYKNIALFIEVSPLGFAIEYGDAGIFFPQ